MPKDNAPRYKNVRRSAITSMVAVAAVPDGPDEAFERFFAREYGRAVSVAFRITRDAAEAEDVAQEVFAQCAAFPRKWSRAWIYTAVVHTALNAIRSRRRRTVRERREFRLSQSLRGYAEASNDPQHVIESRVYRAMLRTALARLSNRDAEILALRYSGFSYREIGDVLGVDHAQIGTRLARAERALKKEIDGGTFD